MNILNSPLAYLKPISIIICLLLSGPVLAAQKIDTDFVDVANKITALMERYHYNPEDIRSIAYKNIALKVQKLALSVESEKEFVKEFNKLWEAGPFSHVNLAISKRSADETAIYLDALKVGEGAKLYWTGNIPILEVKTMMGVDTIEQINEAYKQIDTRKPQALIIDLRNNEGGAFAIKPLISHLISSPLDAGVFVSQRWFNNHNGSPNLEDARELAAWEGWSIIAFWKDVQEATLIRFQLKPSFPNYTGQIYVLVSKRTASAAELTSDALANLNNVTLIGERTSGKMLSQKMYDVTPSLQLSLPIADYYGHHTGRIEGHGVIPNIIVPAEKAMEKALTMIHGKTL